MRVARVLHDGHDLADAVGAGGDLLGDLHAARDLRRRDRHELRRALGDGLALQERHGPDLDDDRGAAEPAREGPVPADPPREDREAGDHEHHDDEREEHDPRAAHALTPEAYGLVGAGRTRAGGTRPG